MKSNAKIFIGSSSEGLKIVGDIKVFLEGKVKVDVWNESLFRVNNNYLSELMDITKEYDFAIFVLTPDDVVNSRTKTILSPRDNVLFEMGLFLGKLGKQRTFIVYDRLDEVKIPSDLFGISLSSYSSQKEDYSKSLIGCCSELLSNILNKGVRIKESENLLTHLTPRTKRLIGIWKGGFIQYGTLDEIDYEVKAEVEFLLKDEKLIGTAKLEIINAEDEISLKFENGFFNGSILKIDYFQVDEFVNQFGSFVLKLDSNGKYLKGKFIGFAPSNESVVRGDVFLEK